MAASIPISLRSRRSALFTDDEVELTPAAEFSEDEVNWAGSEALTTAGPMLETSEKMPSATEVRRMLRNIGERGMLAGFPAVAVGRPKGLGLVVAEERR